MTKLYGSQQNIVGACGIGTVYGHHQGDVSYMQPFNPWSTLYDRRRPAGGAGWSSAGFVRSAACRAMYSELKKNYKIVFQTPVRVNRNSRHQFIFVVYDHAKGNKPMKRWLAECEEHNKEFNYPWK